MRDIVGIGTGVSADLSMFDTQAPRAANILSVQLEALEYAPDFGIDLKYFLNEDFQFQNESFKSYLIERLANSAINVSSVIETLESLYTNYTFNLSADTSSDGSLIAR